MKKRILGLVAAMCLGLGSTQAMAIALELGIAIDGSGSIGLANFNTQRTIYANVLNDPTILPQDGSVAVGVQLFESSSTQIFPTTVIDGTTIGNLIAAINGMIFPSGGTNIGAAINALTADIFGNAIDSDRQVIDVSTDGFGGLGTSVADALAAGIDQINCLGIGGGANCSFAAGAGSFSITIGSIADLEQALRTKIAREIGRVPEPATMALLGIGLLGLGGLRRKARH